MKTKLLKKVRKHFEIKNTGSVFGNNEEYILFDKKNKDYSEHYGFTSALDEIFKLYYGSSKIIKRRRYINIRARYNQIK